MGGADAAAAAADGAAAAADGGGGGAAAAADAGMVASLQLLLSLGVCAIKAGSTLAGAPDDDDDPTNAPAWQARVVELAESRTRA